MTWRDPESGEKRLDRGTEWFLIRDGKIAEVRAYHHGGKKNPQGDLLGFDHEGRGYTMLEDWEAPARVGRVDQGHRRSARTLPPFGEEHEELRETVRRFVAKEIAPHVDEWEEAREFPRELYSRCAELGFLGLKFPEEYGGQGGTTSTTRSGSRSWPARAARAASPPGSTPTPRSRCRRSSTSAPRSRSSAGWCRGSRARRSARWGSPSRAPAPTSPASRTFAARGRRRLRRQRLQDLHHQRRPRRLPRLRLQDDARRAATTASPSSSSSARCPATRSRAKLEKMGWHSSDTGELSFTDVEVPDGEPARRGERAASN